jgi:hypothetical protein
MSLLEALAGQALAQLAQSALEPLGRGLIPADDPGVDHVAADRDLDPAGPGLVRQAERYPVGGRRPRVGLGCRRERCRWARLGDLSPSPASE